MKKHKKAAPVADNKPAPTIALSPREASLRKLYNIATVLAVIAATAGIVWGANALGNYFFPSRDARFGEIKERVFPEPKLNANNPPGAAPEGRQGGRGRGMGRGAAAGAPSYAFEDVAFVTPKAAQLEPLNGPSKLWTISPSAPTGRPMAS